MKKYIIFDFDGTIAATLYPSRDIINRLADKFGFKKVTDEDIPIIKELKPKKLLKYLKIPMRKLPFIAKETKFELNKIIETLDPETGIPDVLRKLRDSGYKLGILTSNSQENVAKFLNRHHLDIFSFVYSESNLFGKSRVLKRLLKNLKIKPDEAIYVGDEVRDATAARRAKIEMISVSWGLNTRRILAKHKPNYIIDKPHELLEVLKV